MIAQGWENIRFPAILSTDSFRSLSLKWFIREGMGKTGQVERSSPLSFRALSGKEFNPHKSRI
jgi:hypothetical protein